MGLGLKASELVSPAGRSLWVSTDVPADGPESVGDPVSIEGPAKVASVPGAETDLEARVGAEAEVGSEPRFSEVTTPTKSGLTCLMRPALIRAAVSGLMMKPFGLKTPGFPG